LLYRDLPPILVRIPDSCFRHESCAFSYRICSARAISRTLLKFYSTADPGVTYCGPILGLAEEHFKGQRLIFQEKAQAEQEEIDRFNQASSTASGKYPSGVDSVRGLDQYYSLKASEMSQRATDSEE
jgi:hypothetical protein